MPEDPARRPKAVVIGTRRKPKGHEELFAALALVSYLVQPGDSLSGIAASHSVALAAVEAANPSIANPNLIYAGQTVRLPGGSSAAHSAVSHSTGQAVAHSTSQSVTASSVRSPSHVASAVRGTSTAGASAYSSGSLSDVPGVPSSLAACVAYRESTNLQDPAANGNAYGIIPASGYNVDGTSLAHQKQVFAELYRQHGGTPWAADGCPGT